MIRLTQPDYVFSKFSDVTPKFLRDLGIKALLVDIDNTIAPYEEATPNEKVVAWLDSLTQNGISVAFISNNNAERVDLFNRELSLVAFSKSGKPFPKSLRAAMTLLGSDKSNTAMLGDQLLTDAMAGKHIGLRAIIVPPIRDKQNAFFRAKRALEVGSIRKYVKKAKKRGDSTQKVCGDAEMICAFWLEKRFSAKYLKNQRKIEEK